MTALEADAAPAAPRGASLPSSGRRLVYAAVVLLLLCLFVAPFFVNLVAGAGPGARGGVVSFAGWGPLTSPVRLQGDWTVIWRGGAGGPAADRPVTVAVPGRWSAPREGRPTLPDQGAAAYHLQIRDLPAGHYVMHVPGYFGAVQVVVDGRVMSARGVAGTTAATTRYFIRAQDVFIETDGRPVNVELDISCFHHRDNGMETAPLIARAGAMLDWNTLDWIRSLLLVTALLLLAAYGFIVFLFHRADRASLYFAIGALSLVPMIGVFLHDNLLLIAFPGLSFRQMLTIQYLFGASAVGFLLAYIKALFPRENPRFLYYPIVGLTGLLVATYAVLAVFGGTLILSIVSQWAVPLRTFSLLYIVVVVVVAAIRRRDGAAVFSLGMIIFTITGIYSDLVTNAVIPPVFGTLDLMPIGMLLLLFSQIVILAERWSLAMGVAEARSGELARLLDVYSSITSEIRLEALLTRIVEATGRFIHADRASLFLYDAKTDELWSIAAEGVGSRQIRFPSDGGLAGACFVAGEPINIADAYADPRFNRAVDTATGYRTTSVLTIPVKARDGRKLGVMQALNSLDGPTFTDADVSRMNALAAQAAIAIDNATLFAEVASERNYNESILRSMSSGVVTLDADARIAKLNQTACRILGVTMEQVADADAHALLSATNPLLLAEVEAVAASGEPKTLLDADVTTARGDTISANLSIVPLIAEDGAASGILVIIEDISESKRMQGAMRRFMTQEVVDQVMGRGDDLLFGAACPASVLFADIRSFTSLSEKLPARDVVEMLNEIFTELFEAVAASDGVLDKFMGDGLMAVYGAPIGSDRDPLNALDSATQMIRMIEALNVRRAARALPALRLGIGVTSGEVIAGTIGSPKRMDYTVIGDSVNLAARLQSTTKVYGVSIVCDEATARAAGDRHVLRELDTIRVRGRVRPERIFQVLTDAAACPGLEAYRRGRAAMAERDWTAAAQAFGEAVALDPDDRPAALMLERARALAADPPDDAWDGVWTAADAA